MPANLENSAVVAGLENVGFHSNLKERHCQRMSKLLHNCTHLTCWKFSKPGFNSMWTVKFQIFKLDLEKAAEAEIKLVTSIRSSKEQESSRKTYTSALWIMPKPLSVWITTNWEIPQEMGMPDHLTCLLRNLYASQEATVRTGHETTDWFQIGKGVRQVCILSSCLFNLYAEYIMRNAGLDEVQAGIKITRRNNNNFRYADDTTLTAESEEELEPLNESERGEWKSWLKAQHSEN